MSPDSSSMAPTSEPTGWRAHLPKIPDPVDVHVPGVAPRVAFARWFVIATAMIVLGVGLNWWLTDGAWIVEEQRLYDAGNPFGDTEVQFLTAQPYDILTASLFVSSTLLLGLSLLPKARANAPYGWWRAIGTLATHRHAIRAAGWNLFAFHWATTAMNFYFVEEGDVVNAAFAFVAVYLLTYFAYQERISKTMGVDNASLRFAAGAVFIAATVWYAFLRVEFLSQWIIEVVAGHTASLLALLGQSVDLGIDGRTGFRSAITYVDQPVPIRTVIIILACTAIQSMMIFVAAALSVAKAAWRRRLIVIGVTVPVVYLLNLTRNVIIIFLWETRWLEARVGISSEQAFSFAHNWIGKFGSLLALVVIALFMFRVLPEVVAAVIGLLDLPRRRGPLEQYVYSLQPGTVHLALGALLGVAGLAVWLVPEVERWIPWTLFGVGAFLVYSGIRRRSETPVPEPGA